MSRRRRLLLDYLFRSSERKELAKSFYNFVKQKKIMQIDSQKLWAVTNGFSESMFWEVVKVLKDIGAIEKRFDYLQVSEIRLE